jgi:hypothetical protein
LVFRPTDEHTSVTLGITGLWRRPGYRGIQGPEGPAR